MKNNYKKLSYFILIGFLSASVQIPGSYAMPVVSSGTMMNAASGFVSMSIKNFILSTVVPTESRYFSTKVGFDSKSGMPLDHIRIRLKNEILGEIGNYTAASKLSLSMSYLLGVIQSKPEFKKSRMSKEDARALLKKTLLTLEKYIQDYPAYNGFLPWLDIRPDGSIVPANNKIPSLDNGQLSWALAAIIGALEHSDNASDREMVAVAKKINDVRDYSLFFSAKKGQLYGTVQVNPYTGIWTGDKSYYLNDMCEGIMAVLWGVLHGQIPEEAWMNIPIETRDYKTSGLEEASTFLGFRASFHEHWGLIFLPLMKSKLAPLYKNYLYIQADYARKKGLPGFLSTAYDARGIYRQMGIPEIASNKVDRSDVAVAFATAMGMLIEPEVGGVWLENFYNFPNVMTKYGVIESVGHDGYADIFTADGKGLTLLAVSGGVVSEVEKYLKSRNVPGTNVTMYDKLMELLEKKNEQMMKSRDRIPLAIPEKPYPLPAGKQIQIQIEKLKQEKGELNISEHLQANHLHGKNVTSLGRKTLEDDVRPGGPIEFDYDILFDENDNSQKWAFRGTYLDDAFGVAGMQYITLSVPAYGERLIYDIEFKSDDIFLAYATIDTAQEGVLSEDGNWKTIATQISIVPDASYKPMNYMAVVVQDERFLRGKYTDDPKKGSIRIKDIRLTEKNPFPVPAPKVEAVPPGPGDIEMMQYWRPSHGGLFIVKDSERKVIRFRGGYGFCGGYVPYTDLNHYKYIRLKVRNTSGNYSNGFNLELKHDKDNLLGQKKWIQLRGNYDWYTLRIRVPENLDQTFNYLAISDPLNDFELASITFES